jgi:hypothetical protein
LIRNDQIGRNDDDQPHSSGRGASGVLLTPALNCEIGLISPFAQSRCSQNHFFLDLPSLLPDFAKILMNLPLLFEGFWHVSNELVF